VRGNSFFTQIVNTLLHLEFDPCKIRAEPLPNLLIR
jgi:hypothetical protein